MAYEVIIFRVDKKVIGSEEEGMIFHHICPLLN